MSLKVCVCVFITAGPSRKRRSLDRCALIGKPVCGGGVCVTVFVDVFNQNCLNQKKSQLTSRFTTGTIRIVAKQIQTGNLRAIADLCSWTSHAGSVKPNECKIGPEIGPGKFRSSRGVLELQGMSLSAPHSDHAPVLYWAESTVKKIQQQHKSVRTRQVKTALQGAPAWERAYMQSACALVCLIMWIMCWTRLPAGHALCRRRLRSS
jgi:hypothetical protein